MAQFFSIHPTHPQARLVRRAADIVRGGGLVAYPTDSCYALGSLPTAAKALERLRRVRFFQSDSYLSVDLFEKSADYLHVDLARLRSAAHPLSKVGAIGKSKLAVGPGEPLALELEAFVRSLRGPAPGAAPGAAGRAALEVAAAVRAAMKQRAAHWAARTSAAS